MPQLDLIAFFNEIFWLSFFFLIFHQFINQFLFFRIKEIFFFRTFVFTLQKIFFFKLNNTFFSFFHKLFIQLHFLFLNYLKTFLLLIKFLTHSLNIFLILPNHLFFKLKIQYYNYCIHALI